MLRDLTIQNYRCFENFYMDGLERVNLFVGNNNSGKTSLLEAIYLLVNPDKLYSLFYILQGRSAIEIIENKYFQAHDLFNTLSIKQLFFDRNLLNTNSIEIKSRLIAPVEIPQLMQPSKYRDDIFIRISTKKHNEFSKLNIKLEYFDLFSKGEFQKQLYINEQNNKISTDNEFLEEVNLDFKKILSLSQNNAKLILQNKTNVTILNNMWGDIYLTEKEDKLVQALQIIESTIQRLGFALNEKHNIIRLKVSGHSEPIPLSSMGEGMYRILVLAMSLVTSENGVLLVDEIETGLHYEAQTDMWRLILETAKELNVQVFATTHSWDCIAAFQEALSQVEDSSIGKLFRLDSKYGKLRAVEYNAEDLDIAVRNSIEVR